MSRFYPVRILNSRSAFMYCVSRTPRRTRRSSGDTG